MRVYNVIRRPILLMSFFFSLLLMLNACSESPIEPAIIRGTTVLPGTITVRTQDEVELLAGIEEITGSLVINSGYDGEHTIINLEALRTLKRVGGDVSVRDNDKLLSVAGLRNLTEVGGVIRFTRNGSLVSLEGSGTALSVKAVSLYEMPALIDFGSWFCGVNVETVSIENCPLITNLKGLACLESCNSITVKFCDAFKNIEGIEQVPNIELVSLDRKSVV